MVGKTVSHYKILEKLGEGGMGVVYKAEDTKLDRFVALKFLPPHLGTKEEEKERFIHEAKAASALQHHNVCTIFEIDETDDGQMFICMDYYEGETLKDKIHRGPMKSKEAIDTLIQVVEGLKEAHEKDIVHRDIKPANIMVTSKGQAKIMDFGLAKLAGGMKLTKTGSTLGTAPYMSPEQVKGKEVDHRTDIWSLGVVLYEMITGQLPFKGEYEQAVSYAIANEEPEPMTGLRTGLPIELEGIVNKALAKKADERYQHVDEMLVDLKNLRKGFETSGVTRSVEVPRKSLKKILIPVGVILVLVLAFFMLRSFLMEEVLSSSPVPIAVISFENQTGDASYDRLQKVIPNLLITSLEQSKYLRVTTWERMYDLLKQMGKQEVELIDRELGFELCSMDGVDAIVLGSITKFGDVFVTDVKVLDVHTKELLKSARSQGEGESSIIKSQIDELSREIAKGVGLSERKVETTQKRIIDVTTNSIEAYNFYVRGNDEFVRRNYLEASNYYKIAVELDSTFAMGYLGLARAYSNLGEEKKRNKTIENAKMYSQKATEKERLYIEAVYSLFVEDDWENYGRIAKEITNKFPKEKRGYWMFGTYYWIKEMNNKAIEEYNKALELDPDYAPALHLLGYSYYWMGELEKALECFKRYASVLPDAADPLDSMGEVYFRMGKLDEAIAKYREALEVDPDFPSDFMLSYIYAMKEKYPEAMKWIDHGISVAPSDVIKAERYWWKGFYHAWLGNMEQSFSNLRRSEEIGSGAGSENTIAYVNWIKGWVYYDRGEFDLTRKYWKSAYEIGFGIVPQNRAALNARNNFRRGLVDLAQGRVDSAKLRLIEIKNCLSKIDNPRQIRYIDHSYDLLTGEVLLAEGKTEKAMTVCRKAVPQPLGLTGIIYGYSLYCVPFLRDVLARVYYQSGELDKAINEYERLITFDPNQKNRYLIHPKYYYRLAKIYEEKGLNDKAIEQYEKFLDIWKHADEDLPEPHAARARLAKLKQGS